jgi:uncharacterized paraquat-inducible protein A
MTLSRLEAAALDGVLVLMWHMVFWEVGPLYYGIRIVTLALKDEMHLVTPSRMSALLFFMTWHVFVLFLIPQLIGCLSYQLQKALRVVRKTFWLTLASALLSTYVFVAWRQIQQTPRLQPHLRPLTEMERREHDITCRERAIT